MVTILFCDVQGSTSMAEQMDAEEWTDLMNAAYEHLIAPVYRHEGTVARLMGDAILAFFGAPTAHEDDPQRAVMAGLEIVASIAGLSGLLAAERGLDLGVRVGINTGPVVVGEVGSELRQEYTAMGDAVNVAARMEQTAEPGTVQITEDTYRLVAELFDVEPLGAVELKGKRDPISAFRVLGRRAAPWRVRAARPLEAPLVGRQPEVAVVRTVLERALAGDGSVLLITGDPGIGKSRLVEEAEHLWDEMGGEPSAEPWQCVPFDTMQPYAQYRRVVRERAGIAEADVAESVREKIAALARLAPDAWAERTERLARALLRVELDDEARLEGEAFQREAIEVAAGTVETLARAGTRLLIFEDLHWCDHASLELVRETARLVPSTPVVCLVTLRRDPGAASWGFRRWVEADLAEHSTVLELDPLTGEQSDELIDLLLPVERMPEDVRRSILEKAEGNPLFLQEVARALIDRGLVERTTDGGWKLVGDVGGVTIPDTVLSLITVGLDRLPESARRTLDAAAVIGKTFDVDVLRAVLDGGDLSGDLRDLERRDLVRVKAPGRELTFRHALTHEAAYGSLLLKRRKVIHGRVAAALEEANRGRLEEVAAALARHHAEAGNDHDTLRFAAMAGDSASRLYANAEAEAHYRTALDVALRIGADPQVLRSLYERRGKALELAGRHAEAIASYEEMREVARTHGDAGMELGANTAIAVLYSTATPTFDAERGRSLSEENVVTARRLGDRAAEARALWTVMVANIYGSGENEMRAVEAGEMSLALAEELGDRAQLAFTMQDVCRAYMALGDLSTAARRLREARALWEELDNRPMLSENFGLTSVLRLFEGDHRRALSDAQAAFSLSEAIENRWGQAYALICRYRIELDLGDLGVATGTIRRCLEIGEGSGFTFAGIVPRADLAHALVQLGDPEGALRHAERALELARRLPPAMPFAQIARAEALAEVGERAAAGGVLDEVDIDLLPGADRVFSHVAFQLLRSRLALTLDRPEEAAVAARSALDYLRSNGIRVLVAEALVTLAEVHLAEGRLDDAERDLPQAVAMAERLEERFALWRGLALLAELRVRRGAPGAAAGLRWRALAIVEEIAEGIAEEALRTRFLGREEILALGRPDRPRPGGSATGE
jgi:class 3 adenylate cyclase/tetratricopeptide (TPR) repeat protein